MQKLRKATIPVMVFGSKLEERPSIDASAPITGEHQG